MSIQNVQNINVVNISNINGDLRIRGYSGSELIIDGEGVHVERPQDGMIRVHTMGDCDLKLPEHLSLVIDSVHGDAKITSVAGSVTIDAVNGDLVIRHIEKAVQINTVNGDLAVKHISSGVKVASINGDCSLQHIEGDVEIAQVHGDLILQDVVGNINIANASSDIAVEVDYMAEFAYNFTTNDDIVFNIAPPNDVIFYIPKAIDYTFTREIHHVATVDEDGDFVTVRFGEGASKVTVHHADDIVFNSRGTGQTFSFDLNMGDQMRDIETQINESLSGIGDIIEAQTREAIESATQFAKDIRVEARIQRARERAERRVERHTERAERRNQRAQRFETRRQPPVPSQPVSSEERMLILQMLQDGKISVEEANQLLSTLEGK